MAGLPTSTARAPQQRQPKRGLQGPETELIDAKLLEMQFKLLSTNEVRQKRGDPQGIISF